ncbi:hypothetical protein [Amycolatopsis speibonae]|uniref:IrrE N-terminal-like domain-containing protein n=1 Tax=Amycolatopsis speibonae TaxID=1450224 RepID=A0ABV7P7C3_9PSEU
MISEILDRYQKYSPWQLHATLDEIFVGRVNSLVANASAHGTLEAAPYVAITDGLYTALDQCVVLWENVSRMQAEVLGLMHRSDPSDDDLREYIEAQIVKRELPELTSRLIDLKLFLVDKDPGFLPRYQNRTELFLLSREGVSDVDFGHRKRRLHLAEGFFIGHELAHILLGHIGSHTKPAAQEYLSRSPALEITDNASLPSAHRDEIQADLTGYREILFASTWEQMRREGFHPLGPDRSQLGLIVQCADGIAIAILAMYLLSALGTAPTNVSTHPHPNDRFTALTTMMERQLKKIIATTSEPDMGTAGRGFFERVSSTPRQVHTIYSRCKGILETALREVTHHP